MNIMRSLTLLWKRSVQLFTKEIWQPAHIGKKSLRGWTYAFLRVISITITGILATRAFARAAALSFTTLLSLGPLIALAMLVAGFVLKDKDPDMIANELNKMIKFVAPQVDHYEEIRQQNRRANPSPGRAHSSSSPDAASASAPAAATPAAPEQSQQLAQSGAAAPAPAQAEAGARKVRPEIVRLINNFITTRVPERSAASARSRSSRL